MAKIYTDEEIRRLSQNPCVFYVCRHQMSLTLEFRQMAYDEWLKKPTCSTVKKLLEANGFDIRDLGKDFCLSLSSSFRRRGRPKYSRMPGSDSEALAYGPSFLGDTMPLFPPGSSMVGFINGQETMAGSQARPAAGNSTHHLEGRTITPERAAFLSENPYVSAVTPDGITLGDNFFLCASLLLPLGMDEILDVFLIGRDLMTQEEKSTALARLRETPPTRWEDIPRHGETAFDSHVLKRREAALERLAGKNFAEIKRIFPRLICPQKKKVCLWLETLPKDPACKFTKRETMRRIGVSKSAYYRYVNSQDYGLSWLARKKQEEEDARLVRQAFEYKGFRKGSRQVYMLLPRLTGKKFSIRKIRRLMKAYGMEHGIRGANPARRAAMKKEEQAVKPNFLRRRFRLHRPNQVRVTDVTTLDYGGGQRAYGSALMDPVTSRLIAFVVSGDNDLELALETLRRSDSHPCEDGGIFHSDQGVLYKHDKFQEAVLERGYTQSMSKKGNCWDNATQESFFGHFKDECDYKQCQNLEELKEKVAEYSFYYDNERGMWERCRMTPVEYEGYLAGMDDEEFARYLEKEQKKYDEMKERAAELAKKRYGTLGV